MVVKNKRCDWNSVWREIRSQVTCQLEQLRGEPPISTQEGRRRTVGEQDRVGRQHSREWGKVLFWRRTSTSRPRDAPHSSSVPTSRRLAPGVQMAQMAFGVMEGEGKREGEGRRNPSPPWITLLSYRSPTKVCTYMDKPLPPYTHRVSINLVGFSEQYTQRGLPRGFSG